MASASATSVQSQSSLPQNTCTVPLLGVRGPGGVQLVTSPVHSESVEKVLSHDVENCRLTCFSRSGHQFVMGDGTKVQVYCCNTRHVLYEINKRKICAIKYSPNDTYLLLFEPFSAVPGEEEPPNLFIYKSDTGELVGQYVQKRQADWCDQLIYEKLNF
ncbi:unnamed protein product [Didymodactylos carnosus]|uniref:Uncharacterized protein n=1 Tax=Didymodactylos carnosus TaxID=1234261 RepID=A0A8S2CSU7_9BILA|nr:unnamed protein product [Didymodactylos carnosus]CAF3510286.1 unnamed protein product [Didymodactylos carnosus]